MFPKEETVAQIEPLDRATTLEVAGRLAVVHKEAKDDDLQL